MLAQTDQVYVNTAGMVMANSLTGVKKSVGTTSAMLAMRKVSTGVDHRV